MGEYADWYCGIFTEAYLKDKSSPTEEARPSHDLIEREGLPYSNTILLQQQKFPRSNTIIAAPERWFQDEVSSEEPQEISRGHGELSPQASCRATLEGTNYPHTRRRLPLRMCIYHTVELYRTVHVTVEKQPSE